MEAKVSKWKRKLPSKRQITSTLDQFLQEKSVAILYTPAEQKRIREMTEMIMKATCEYETQEDWERILSVVDAMSSISSHAVLKESIRFLKIRLGDPSSRAIILALILTESIVKNCGALVHSEIATESFLSQMEALYKTHHERHGRDSVEITERVLEMIQSWGEAFLPYRNRFPLFIQVYHNMRKKGVRFPKQYDENRVPVLEVDDQLSQIHKSPQTAVSNLAIDFMIQVKQMTDMQVYSTAVSVVEMFEDVLHEAKKETCHLAEEGGVICELAEQTQVLIKRMEEIIQSAVAQGDEDLEKLLVVNDSLNQTLREFEVLSSRNRDCGNQEDYIVGGCDNEEVDDDFDAFIRERTNTIGNENINEDNEDKVDPFASFVEERAVKVKSVQETPLSNNLTQDLIDFSEDTNQVNHSKLSQDISLQANSASNHLKLIDDIFTESVDGKNTNLKMKYPFNPFEDYDEYNQTDEMWGKSSK
ncbi:unnamed protein product [Albugo candida]|nr:unnamed protein product [Albugo candida]|eukprot:CCI46030.1 unnamed protein product [Albugo candida]